MELKNSNESMEKDSIRVMDLVRSNGELMLRLENLQGKEAECERLTTEIEKLESQVVAERNVSYYYCY